MNPDKRLPLVTKHKMEHHIRVKDGPPITANSAGWMRRSWRKPDGSWRPCGNYHRLNLFTIPDSYPLLNMMDFVAKMSGCRSFSKVDLH